MRALLLSLLIGVVILGVTPHAQARAGAATRQAQAPRLAAQVTYKQRREAKRLFDQAHLAYRRGDYEEAILKWQESYELSKEPLIFESIANAYERLGDPKEALEYLRKWREKAPRREHKALDSRIENLEARVARIDEEERLKREEEEARQREEEERRRREEEERRRREEEAAREEEGLSPMQILGWSLVGVGGAAVVAGVVMDIVAAVERPNEQDACSEQGDMLYCRDALREDIEATNQLAVAGDIVWIAGAAITVGGVVVLVIAGQAAGSTEPDDGASTDDDFVEDARLVPLIGPTGGGLLVTASF